MESPLHTNTSYNVCNGDDLRHKYQNSQANDHHSLDVANVIFLRIFIYYLHILIHTTVNYIDLLRDLCLI